MTAGWTVLGVKATTRAWGLAILSGALLSLAACGGDDDSANALFDDGGDGSGGTLAGARTAEEAVDLAVNNSELADEELVDVLVFYQDFLGLTDRARFGDGDATDAVSAVADGSVLAQLDAWQAENEAFTEEEVGVTAMASLANVATISGDDDALILNDCTEVAEGRQILDLTTVTFVDQLVFLSLVDGEWTVTGIEVRNDGALTSGTTGCAPAYHVERIEASTESLLTSIANAYAKPELGLTPDLAGRLDEPMVAQYEQGLSFVADEGVYLDAPETYEVEVLGSDSDRGNRVFRVGVCTTLPEGQPWRSVETDELVDDGPTTVEPGGSVYQEYFMRAVPLGDGRYEDRLFALGRQLPDADCGGSS